MTVFPLSYVTLFADEPPIRFLIIEGVGAIVCVGAVVASGVIADRVGRALLGFSAVLIGAYSGFAPQLLATRFGLWSVGAYLPSGAICTLAALAISRDWGETA